jgi:hypothetical protein
MPDRVGLSTQIFCVPLEDPSGYLLYAPDVRTAVVGNVALVNFLADVELGHGEVESHSQLLRLLEALSLTTGPTPRHNTETDAQGTATCRHLAHVRLGGDTQCDVVARELACLLQGSMDASRQPLIVTYEGCTDGAGWRALLELHTVVAGFASEFGCEIHGSVVLDAMPDDEHLDWILRWMNFAIVRLRSGEDRTPLISRLDAANFSYELEIRVLPTDFERLGETIDTIVTTCHPSRIVVEPGWATEVGDDRPSSVTVGFVEAFRMAQLVALEHGRELVFRGTALNEDVDFYGLHRGETLFTSRDASRVVAAATARYCDGCFARATCRSGSAVPGCEEFAGAQRCFIVRELARDAILVGIERAGGIAWLGSAAGAPSA